MNESIDEIIECKQVTKYFCDSGNKLQIFANLDFAIHKGEQIAILGQSGAGKTTLLQLLGGLDLPSSGSVCIDGVNFREISDKQRARLRNKLLGFVYQMHHLLPEFSALENVAMPLLIGEHSIDYCIQTATALLQDIGLGDRIHHRPKELSGGERQRVAIARAIVNKPSCVLADEPTGNLDKKNADLAFSLMQDLNRVNGSAVVMVTHDHTLANRMDKIYILKEGHLTAVD